MVVANNIRIRIRMNFGDLPPTTSAGCWAHKKKVPPSRSTLSVVNGGICLVASFHVVAIGTSVVTNNVTSVGPVIMIGLELSA